MGQFKAGDMALIVACLLPELIGKTVELVTQISPGDEMVVDGRNWINFNDTAGWVVAGRDLLVLTDFGHIEKSDVTFIAEHKLMPLRGDFHSQQQKSRQVKA